LWEVLWELELRAADDPSVRPDDEGAGARGPLIECEDRAGAGRGHRGNV